MTGLSQHSSSSSCSWSWQLPAPRAPLATPPSPVDNTWHQKKYSVEMSPTYPKAYMW